MVVIFNNEEAAMIDGMIGTLLGGANVEETVRRAYQAVHQHLAEGFMDKEDLCRISAAADFAMRSHFCEACNRESQRVLTTILVKATASAHP